MNNATFTLDCEQCLIFLLSYGDQEHVWGAERSPREERRTTAHGLRSHVTGQIFERLKIPLTRNHLNCMEIYTPTSSKIHVKRAQRSHLHFYNQNGSHGGRFRRQKGQWKRGGKGGRYVQMRPDKEAILSSSCEETYRGCARKEYELIMALLYTLHWDRLQ